MKKQTGCFLALVLTLAAGTAQADFNLGAGDYLVSTYHHKGDTYNVSRAYILSGGYVDYLYAHDSSTVNLSGGYVGRLYTIATSTVNMSGGDMGTLDARDSSTVNVSGGYADDLDALGSSRVNLSNGSVYAIGAYGSSTVDFSGGSVNYLYVFNSSTVDLSAGDVGSLVIDSATPGYFSTVNISGGYVDRLTTVGRSTTVNLSGGDVGSLTVSDSSTIIFDARNFHLGSGLTLDGQRVLGTGILGGEWFDGTSWSVNITANDPGAMIEIVPEPATLGLLALGGLALLRRRKGQ